MRIVPTLGPKLALLAAIVLFTAAGAAVGVALTPVAPPRAPNVRGPVVTPPLQKLVVTSPYGPRVLRGKLGVHRGIDLRARMGTPLAAVGPGVVSKTHRTKKGGLSVVVQLDDGWRVGYAHMSRVDVSEGARVAAGARVGLSGDTGTEGAPHLHFELRDPKSKALIDPWPHLARHAPRSRLEGARASLDDARVHAARTVSSSARTMNRTMKRTMNRSMNRSMERAERTFANVDVTRTLARTDVARTLARHL